MNGLTLVAALTRHILTTVGGGLLAKWGLGGSEIEAIAGAIATLAAIGWSLYDKKKNQP